jgi:peptide/nickel transport system substrate-binding protein
MIAVVVIIIAAAGLYWWMSTPSQEPEPSPEPEPGPEPEPDEPKVGGTLTVGMTSEIRTLDPLWMSGTTAPSMKFAIAEPLLFHGFSLTDYHPGLAESYEKIDDVTYEFKLREGVKFHDGTPFNASAVVFTLNRIMTTDAPLKGMVSFIESVEEIDNYNVRITLKKPYADFLHIISFWTWIESPTAVLKWGDEDYGRHPVGTGPYKFKEWIEGDRIILERNEDYWGGESYLDEIVYRVIPDSSVLTMELELGNIDVAGISFEELPRLEAETDLVFWVGPPGFFSYYSLNHLDEFSPVTGEPNPLIHKDVRQAISYALDRDTIIDAVVEGYGTPAIGPMLPSMKTFYNEEIPHFDYDLEKAQELMIQAGYEDGFDINLRTTSSNLPRATIFQEMMSKININVEIELIESATYVPSVLWANQFDIVLGGWGGAGPTPMQVMELMFHSHAIGGWNYHRINDSRVDDLLDRISTISPPEDAVDLVDEIQEIIIEECWIVFSYYGDRIFVAQPYVKGVITEENPFYHPNPWYGQPVIPRIDALGIHAWIDK